jgi:hypothetical protein
MRTRTIFVLTVAVVTLGAALTAEAAVVSNVRFKGNQVFTGFSGSTTITCADGTTGEFSVNGFLNASESFFKTPGSPASGGNGISVDVSWFNSCTNEFRFASGFILNGLTPPNKKLQSASLEGTGQIQDFSDGAIFDVAVDVAVVGEGPISAGKSVSHTRIFDGPGGPISITHSNFANANRSGIATGTITIDGVELTPEFSFTTLNFNNNSQLIIER